MNQQRSRGRGNAPRQVQRAPENPTPNQGISLRDRAKKIIAAVNTHRAEIEIYLPSNIRFEHFQGTLTTALRHNPDILFCTIASIVQACCKAAYDGLNLDGKEAALVPQNVNVSKRNEPDRWEKQARYNPMVFGFIKQMIDSGIVADAHATLVYEGEPYRVVRGTDERIEHEEIPEHRGPSKPIRAVYAIARLTNGLKKFETMSKEDVDAVQAVAATDYVWKKNPGEMTRKTVIRRLRKSIAGGRHIRDAEAMMMFPHFDTERLALPAPPRPERSDFQKPAELEHQQNVDIDLFTDFDRTAETVFAETDQGAQTGERREAKREETPDKTRRARGAKGGGEEARKGGDAAPETAGTGQSGAGGEEPEIDADGQQAAEEQGDRPEPEPYQPKVRLPNPETMSDQGWERYADTLIAAIPELRNVDALNAERRAHEPIVAKAPPAIRTKIADAFADALSDLV